MHYQKYRILEDPPENISLVPLVQLPLFMPIIVLTSPDAWH